MDLNKFEVHDIDWTEDKIKRFWDYVSGSEYLSRRYFTDEVGDSLVDFVKDEISQEDTVLDYGTGSGYLIEKLLKKNFNCIAVDNSEQSLLKIEKFKSYKNFKGSALIKDSNIPLNDKSVDFIFFVETIEHMLDDQVDKILKEFQRILKVNGKIFITLPNRENLEKYKYLCPDCGAKFHYMQHINRHSKETLEELLKNYGFHKIKCGSTLFIKKTVYIHLKNIIKYFYKSKNLKNPHLYFVGKKI